MHARKFIALVIIPFMVGCTAPTRSVVLPDGISLQTAVGRRTWQYPYGTGLELTTSHYRIFTSSTTNRTLLAYLPGFLEAAYVNYLDLTGLADRTKTETEPKPLDVYMLANRQEWVELTRWVLGPEAPPLAISAGGYSHKGVGVYWDLHHRTTFAVASHEGLHQFLYQRLKHRLPLIIEEGLAVCAEGFHLRQDMVNFMPTHNPQRLGALRRTIIQDRWIPIDRLLGMDAGDVIKGRPGSAVGWYGQAWALVLFLRSRDDYSAGLARMLADAEAGRFDRALHVPSSAFNALSRRGRLYNRRLSRPLFAHYITTDLETFERNYRAFAWKLVDLTGPVKYAPPQ